MKQLLTFLCECGRSYILQGEQGEDPRKCPHCGRVLKIKDEVEREDRVKSSFQQLMKGKSPSMSALDETWEYEYKFGANDKQRMDKTEFFTFSRFFKKLWTLFFPGKTRRF